MKDIDITSRKNTPRWKEAGNAIVMLFAAVGMAGVVTYGLNNVMRGPGMMTAEVSRKTIAENNLVASSRLAINAATTAQANDGDCDGDGFVEPVPFRDAGALPAPAGGGLIPMTIGASTSDPWGAQYGYCVWDAGTVKTSDAHAGCGGAGANRLDGGPKDNQPAIAVISAGKNGVFETSCNAYIDTTPADGKPDTPMVDRPAGSDDVVLSYTYAEANGIGGGEWKLKTADNTTAEVGKNLEIGGGGTFSGPVELTQKGLVLPGDPGDNSITGACTAAKDQQIRRNTSTTPPSLEICDFAGGGWTAISGGGGSGGGGATDPYFNPNLANCTANEGGPLTLASSTSVPNGGDVYSDQSYIYVTEGNALGVYQFNGTNFTRIAGFGEGGANSVIGVTGDGTYVYIANEASDRVEAWYFNGTDGVMIDTAPTANNIQDIWSDDQNVYVANFTTFRAYTFDGIDLSLRDTETVSAHSVGGDGTYIYSGGSNDLRAWTFDGTALTQVGATALAGDLATELWGESSYLYVALVTRMAAFTFNGTTFTQVASEGAIPATDLWGDGTNIFVSTASSVGALDFNGTTFTTHSAYLFSHDSFPQIRGDGNYIYSFTGTTGAYNLIALGGYRCTEPPPRLYIPDPSYEEDPIVASDSDTLDEGMIAHWPMNEGTGTTVEDVVGNYDGTFINTPIWNEGPDGDGSLSFDMDDRDGVQITGLMGNPSSGAISFWVNVGRLDTGAPPRQSDIFSMGDTIVVSHREDAGLVAFYPQGLNSWIRLDSYRQITGMGWHYVTTTFDDPNNVWRLYIDGVLVASSTANITLNYAGMGTNTFIGRQGNGIASYDFDGGIDDVRMWNRALSPGEVAALYKRERKQSATRELSAMAAMAPYQGLLGHGEYSTCAIKADGTPWCWGNDASEQLGNGPGTSMQTSPVPVSIPTARTYYLVSTNSDLSPASNIYTKKLLTEPTVANTPNATALAAGASNDGYGFTEPGIFGKDDGGGPRPYSVTMSYTSNAASACMRASVYAARVNSTGVVQGSEVRLGSPTFLTTGNTTFAGDADLGVFAATDRLRIRYNMQNTCTASQSPSINFDDDPKVVVPALEYPAWVQVTGYTDTMCGLRGDGTAWCWGSDTDGRLGNGAILTDNPQSVPTPVVNTTSRWSKISMGRDHGCGIKEDGTLWCWGSDTEGQLGNGATTGAQATPVQVGAATDWIDVSAGWTYTCGIRAGGFGYCWGDDTDLQLGNDAASADQISPVAISGGSWAHVYAGYYTSYGIKTDGTLWAWGDDTDEQLGTSATSTDQGIPVQIQVPGPWVETTGGLGYGCALRADSTVWCWGNFANNRLGYPATADTNIPKMVIGSQGAVTIAGSSDSACLMKADRSVWCWGRDHLGQIGNGAVSTGDTYLTAVTGFPGKPGWSWNDAATLITPPIGANISLPGNYLSPTANNDGLGFVSSGRANLRSVTDPGQLLVETTAASASSQMSFSNDIGTAPPADYLTGLAARWEFNDGAGTTAADTSGNGNTFTLGSGASTRPAWTTGIMDGALDFDGADDFLTRTNTASLNINTTLTLMAWVRFDASITGFDEFRTIIGKLNSTSANMQYRMGTYEGHLTFDYCSSASAACGTYNAGVINGVTLTTGQWYHLAITFNNTTDTVAMYINGVPQAWTNDYGNVATANMRTTTLQLYSGYGIDGDGEFEGLIDEIRIYNVDLTPAQILGIYNFTMGTADPDAAYTMGVDYGTNNFEIGRDVLAATNYLNAIDPDIAITQAGRVGVGTAAPGAKMEVAGGVKFGAESYCAAGRDGAIRYVAGSYEYCDGTDWQPLGGGGGGGGASATPGPSGGLIHYWKLDETSGTAVVDSGRDASTGDFTGQWNGNPTPATITSDVGRDGTSYLIDDDYIDDMDPINFSNGDGITISLWNRMTDTDYGDSRNFIMDVYGGPSTSSGWGLALWNDDLNFVYKDTGGTWRDYVTTSTVYQNGVWKHYAVTYTFGTGASMQMYVNGQPVAGGWVGGATGNNPPQMGGVGTWMSGRDDGPWTGMLQGNMDDVRIYDRRLSATEVEQIFACTGGAGACNYTGIPDGLVAYWKMDETAGTTVADMVAAKNGTFAGEAAVVPVAGQKDGALDFDGSNDRVTIPDDPSFDNWDLISYSAWVKPASAGPAIWQTVVHRQISGTEEEPFGLFIEGDSGNTYFTCAINTNVGFFAADSTTEAGDVVGDWTHVACTYDGSELAAYVNGVKEGTTAATGNIVNETTPITIGAEYQFAALDSYFDGAIDDVMIFDRGLSNAEVLSLYNSGGGGGSVDTWKTTRLPSTHETVAAGWGGSFGIKTDGSLWSWGDDGVGILGENQDTTNKSTPVPVHSDSSDTGWNDWVSISYPNDDSAGYACGLRANGTAWCWGDAFAGNLGDGDYSTDAMRPRQVIGEGYTAPYNDWAQIDGSCGVRANGLGYCWGESSLGEVGSGTTTDTEAPDEIGGGYSDWLMIKHGGVNCGLRANGTVWCWGRGLTSGGGTLGNGTNSNSSTPVQVHDNDGAATAPTYWNDWIFIDGSVEGDSPSGHTCGIRANHTLWCWGEGSDCQLGDDVCTDATRPVQVGTSGTGTLFSDWVYVSAGGNHSCGIRANGTLWCWGLNDVGQLGIANYVDSGVPEQVTDTDDTTFWTDWVTVSAGWRHTCGVRVNGDMYCWGENLDGRLGNNQIIGTSTTPQAVIQNP